METIMTLISSICAMLAMLLTILVCNIYVLRVMGKKRSRDHWINKWNRKLRKMHIPLGIALTIASILHGAFSSVGIFNITWGMLACVFLILLCISYLVRKKLKPNWMLWHRALTVAFLICLVLHFVELSGLRDSGERYMNNTVTSGQMTERSEI